MRNALWLDSLTITEEPRDFEVYGRIRWRCEPANALDHCIKCGVSADRLYKHGANPKKYADLPHAGHHVYICIWVQRYRCRECGGTFDHPLPEMDDNRKMTNRCVAYVREHGKRRTFADIAREIGVDEKTIRAKALLAPTMGKMKPCDRCDTATPAKTLREVTASDGWTGDVCGNCHYDFHKMHQQFIATETA